MSQASDRYAILFEPVRIGPVTRNRFYQVPHCNGIGYRAHGPCGDARREGRGRLGRGLHRGD